MANLSSDDLNSKGVATAAVPTVRSVVGDNAQDDESAQALSDGKWYALVVGIDTYSMGIAPLKGAVADAKAVIAELERAKRLDRYEKVFSCIDKDASRAGLMRTFAELRRTLRGEKNARLFIYYAGHGIAAARPEDVDLKTPGYFIPHDAQLGNKHSYLSMKTVEMAINQLKGHVRHLLLVLDCCFAGAFRWSGTQFRNLEGEPGKLCLERFKRFLREPSWHVLTSSAQDEQALDTIDGKVMLVGGRGGTPEALQKQPDSAGARSPFAVALLHGLRGGADKDIDQNVLADGVITGSELHSYIAGYFDSWELKGQRSLQKPTMFPWPTKQNCKGEFIFLNPNLPKLALLPTPPLNEENIPYCGLGAYQEKNRDLFFGRTQAKEHLCKKVKGQGLTVVVGASGTGKSSLVLAGLVPCLRMEKEPAWHILTSRQAGQFPLAALEAIATELGAAKTDSLATAVADWCGAHPRTQLLLIIDQLEELITQSTPEDRAEFLRRLDAARATSQLHVVLTLRSDFEPHFHELLATSDSTRFLIPHVSRAELHEMIEKPASSCELCFDPPELVENLVDEVIDAPGALPLLSFTLREMVRFRINDNIKQNRIDRTLRREDYEKLGGVSGALSKRADEIYEHLPDDAHRTTLRQLILRMVVPGDHTRRRVLRSELVYVDKQENRRVEAVLKQLVDARLLVTSIDNQNQPCVEPAHDKLVMGWQRLHTFLEEDKEALPLARSLTQAVQEWEKLERQGAVLWSGGLRLLQLRALGHKHPQRFNAAETAFINRSIQRQRNIYISIVGTVLFIIVGLIAGILIVTRDRAEINKQLLASLVEQGQKSLEQGNLAEAVLLFHQAQSKGSQEPDLQFLLHSAMQSVDATTVLVGHKKSIERAEFSPNGSRVVTASADKTAQVWDADSGRPIGQPMLHQQEVYSATFSPDGHLIVTASADHTARIWDATSGRPIGQPMRHEDSVNSATFSADGRLIVTASEDETTRIWDATSGRPIGQPMRHEDSVNSALFSPNGHLIVTVGRDNTAQVWDAASGLPIGRPMRHKMAIHSATFSPNSHLIVTASWDNTAQVWDSDSGLPIGKPMRHEMEVNSATFSHDGRFIVTASQDHTARVWKVDSKLELTRLKGHASSVFSAKFSSDDRFIVTASADKTARVWDAHSGQSVATLKGHGMDVDGATFSRDGLRIVTTSADNTARVWKAVGGPLLAEHRHAGHAVLGAAFCPKGPHIVTASGDETATVWNADSKELATLMNGKREVAIATFSPDCRRIVTANRDGTAQVWNADNGQPIGKPMRHNGSVHSATFNPDGSLVVTASEDNTAQVWNADTGDKSGETMQHENQVMMATFSSDGTLVATASMDNTAQVWRVGREQSIGTTKLPSYVYSVAFSPDAQRLVTACGTGEVQVWEVNAKQPIVTLQGHADIVMNATFSHDGRRIVTASNDYTARVWDAASGRFLGELARHTDKVRHASFSPDDLQVVTWGWDNTVRLWDQAPEKRTSAELDKLLHCNPALAFVSKDSKCQTAVQSHQD